MKLPVAIPVSDLAKEINAQIIGNQKLLAKGINEIHKVQEGDITFVDHEKYYKKSLNSPASIIIINKETDCPPGKTLLLCDKPFEAYNGLVKKYRKLHLMETSLSKHASVGEATILEANVVLGDEVKLGKNCHIHANVTIYDHTTIGDNVIIHSGTVVGGHAFYFKKENGQYQKWRSCGEVVIEDNVEIGANCTIDKGVSGTTKIGAGTKIDNLVHIAHGVELGKNCLIAAQVGIAGKTIVEDNVVMLGQVGVSKSLRIGEGAQLFSKSGVNSNLKGGQTYFGQPAIPIKEWMSDYRFLKSVRRLIKNIQEKIN